MGKINAKLFLIFNIMHSLYYVEPILFSYYEHDSLHITERDDLAHLNVCRFWIPKFRQRFYIYIFDAPALSLYDIWT